MQTKINARIVTETVLKVKQDNGYYYRGVIIATLNDGQELEYAIKTKLDSFTADTIITKANGEWVEAQPSEIVTLVTTRFFTFLNLMKDCFFSKYARNQLFLDRNRLLRDNTPATDRMKYSSRITNAVYLIDGRFIKVVYAKKRPFTRIEPVYFEMPLDMGSDWVVMPDASNEMHSLCITAASDYRRGLGDYNLRQYHKELVNKGIRM